MQTESSARYAGEPDAACGKSKTMQTVFGLGCAAPIWFYDWKYPRARNNRGIILSKRMNHQQKSVYRFSGAIRRREGAVNFICFRMMDDVLSPLQPFLLSAVLLF